MAIDNEKLKNRVLCTIQQILPTYTHGTLGEQLDSLHRIFVIEQLGIEFRVNLHPILFNRSAWLDIDSLVNALLEEIVNL